MIRSPSGSPPCRGGGAAVVLAREVVVELAEPALAEQRAGHFAERVRQPHERVLRGAQDRRGVLRREQQRVRVLVETAVRGDVGPEIGRRAVRVGHVGSSLVTGASRGSSPRASARLPSTKSRTPVARAAGGPGSGRPGRGGGASRSSTTRS